MRNLAFAANTREPRGFRLSCECLHGSIRSSLLSRSLRVLMERDPPTVQMMSGDDHLRDQTCADAPAMETAMDSGQSPIWCLLHPQIYNTFTGRAAHLMVYGLWQGQ